MTLINRVLDNNSTIYFKESFFRMRCVCNWNSDWLNPLMLWIVNFAKLVFFAGGSRENRKTIYLFSYIHSLFSWIGFRSVRQKERKEILIRVQKILKKVQKLVKCNKSISRIFLVYFLVSKSIFMAWTFLSTVNVVTVWYWLHVFFIVIFI